VATEFFVLLRTFGFRPRFFLRLPHSCFQDTRHAAFRDRFRRDTRPIPLHRVQDPLVTSGVSLAKFARFPHGPTYVLPEVSSLGTEFIFSLI